MLGWSTYSADVTENKVALYEETYGLYASSFVLSEELAEEVQRWADLKKYKDLAAAIEPFMLARNVTWPAEGPGINGYILAEVAFTDDAKKSVYLLL